MNTPESPEIALLQQRLSDMEARFLRYQEMFPGALNRMDELDKEREFLRAEVKRLRDGLEKLVQELPESEWFDTWIDEKDSPKIKLALASAQALLCGAAHGEPNPHYYSPNGDLLWGWPHDVRHLILQLRTLDQDMRVGTVTHVTIDGKSRSRVFGLSMSYERWDEAGWLDFTLTGPKHLALWANPRETTDGHATDSPTGTADDAIPSAMVGAIREHLATLEESSEVRPHAFVYTLGFGVNMFCGLCYERANHPIHAWTEPEKGPNL